MNEEERLTEIGGISEDTARLVAFLVFGRQPEITFRVIRVIILPCDHRGPCNTTSKHLWLANCRHGRKIPAEGPSHYANPLEVHSRFLFCQRLQTGNLIAERNID